MNNASDIRTRILRTWSLLIGKLNIERGKTNNSSFVFTSHWYTNIQFQPGYNSAQIELQIIYSINLVDQR